MNGGGYAELQATSHFSFLRGASSCEELFAQAAAMGIGALAIVDRNSLAGIVRAHEAAKVTGVRLIVGCRLDLMDGTSWLVYPTDRPAYARLCRLLSLGKRRGGKGRSALHWQDLAGHGEGQVAVLVPELADEACRGALRRLRGAFAGRAYLALAPRPRPNDPLRLHQLSRLAEEVGVGQVAAGDVLFHAPHRRVLQDVVTCIRHRTTIDRLGERRERHADRHLRHPNEMRRLLAHHPQALAATWEVAERCRFSLDELGYQYPEERDDPTLTPLESLAKLAWQGAAGRYPGGVPARVAAALRHELALIDRLGYAPYFLTVDAIVRFARSRGILCQGRGSAANSAVCYVLGITSLDPERHNLLFERFVSAERQEPPDIDVDFEHDRRETVVQWVLDTYGRDHAALCATVVRYGAKSALREVGRALGLPEDLVGTLSGRLDPGDEADQGTAATGQRPALCRRARLTLILARQLLGTPRHLSQHPGGFVLTHDRLDDLVPIEPAAMPGRQVIEWDKDDIEQLRFMKVDVLALGMLSCIRRALDLLAEHRQLALTLATIPAECPRTYEMISRADTLGTFQIESRAQMSMLPRMRPRTYYDLVVQVAIVRPGPIQGDMVHPYLRRRAGLEPVHHPTAELARVLGKTLGVPLFQEQAMQVAIACAGFGPGEADMLRRSMATFKVTGGVGAFRDRLIGGMVANGYRVELAEQIFRQLEGFGSYGFPESHAASFALIAYASAWLKCWHPEVFCAALLNSQPMGFYAPAQVVRDARAHGVEVRPVCANASAWDCTLERSAGGRLAVRLGLRAVKGLARGHADRVVGARAGRPYASVGDLWQRAGVPVAALAQLAKADGFRPGLGLARRQALWAIAALRGGPLPLFGAAARRRAPAHRAAHPEAAEPEVALRPLTAGGEVAEDYRHTGLSLRGHPLSFLRGELAAQGMVSCRQVAEAADGRWLEAAGVVLFRQRPGSAQGVMFITVEDESGTANVVVWPQHVARYRRTIVQASLLAVRGRVQREGEVVHLVAYGMADLSQALSRVGGAGATLPLEQGRGDCFRHVSQVPRPPRRRPPLAGAAGHDGDPLA